MGESAEDFVRSQRQNFCISNKRLIFLKMNLLNYFLIRGNFIFLQPYKLKL